MNDNFKLIDLFCGRAGWTTPALDRGWSCIGYDIEDHGYPGTLRQVPLPIDVQQLRHERPTLVVASPPCEDFARRWLPWKRIHGPIDERLLRWSISLTRQLDCPVIVECSRFAGWEVPGGIEIGSQVFWGDVPALMPRPRRCKQPWHPDNLKRQNTRAAIRATIPAETASWSVELAERKAGG